MWLHDAPETFKSGDARRKRGFQGIAVITMLKKRRGEYIGMI
jgi:hypothetical protein